MLLSLLFFRFFVYREFVIYEFSKIEFFVNDDIFIFIENNVTFVDNFI